MVNEVLGIGYFTIFNIINMVSDPLFQGLRLTDAGVGGENVLSLSYSEMMCVIMVARKKGGSTGY